MKYERFEGLPVWEAAVDLAVRLDAFMGERLARAPGDLRSQLLRAAISISNNIAEGFERGTTQEMITFLYIARGSAGEVRSMLALIERLERFRDLKLEISSLKSQSEGISRQLRGWADSLQNSPIKGQRYLTDAGREEEARKQRSAEFWEKLTAMREGRGAVKASDDEQK